MPIKKYLTDYLAENAAQVPNKEALVTEDRTLTWKQLHQKVGQAASFLASKLSSEKQQIVAIFLPNSWEFVVAYLAILEAGHIALPVDWAYKQLELKAVISQFPVRLIVTNQAGKEILGETELLILCFDQLHAEVTLNYQPLRLSPEEQIASMLFTSGTTGKPKAAPYTHANHLWNIATASKLYAWSTEDTILLSLPLSHWHGLVMGISGALYHGNTVYLQERFNPETTLSALSSGQISLFMHVSLVYGKLLQYAPEKSYDLKSLRLCISASSALPPKVWQGFKERFGIEILERYGSSEAGQIASNSLTDRVPGSPGKQIPGTELSLSETGEVVIKTPGLFPGYYENEAATKACRTADGGWLTGDIGEFDKEGHLFLKGRIQEKIKKNGSLVFPRDVEWAMQQNNSAIQEIFVMGTQNPELASDKITYFVVGSLSEVEIMAYCKEQLPAAWRPDRIILLEAIPRTRSGKPVLSELRALIS